MAGIGLLLFLLAAAGLPWGSAGGEDVTRSDIQDAYEAAQDAGLEDEDFVGMYAQWIWIVALVFLAAAAVFSTLVVPGAKAPRIILGFLLGGVIGLAVNAVDEEGTFGPRVTSAMMTMCVAGLHTLALFLFFDDNDGLDPALGVWASGAGIGVVLLGCVLGTRLERSAPAAASGPAYGYR